MTVGTAARRSPRTLGVVCLGLGLAAVALWAASALDWFVVTPAGRGPVTISGAAVAPSLTGVALLALAGVAGVVATGGVLRRLVGALLGGAGVTAGAVVLRSLLGGDPFSSDAPASRLPQPPAGIGIEALRHQPTDVTAAPLLGALGALLLLVVGLVVALREPWLPRFGARYAAQGVRPPDPDPDRAAWQDLDSGRDPTADAPADRGDDPDGRARSGPL